MEIMTAIEKIRNNISEEIFDYTHVMHALSGYKKPRDVVTRLLKNGDIIRIRKGLYVFGKMWQRQIIPKETLANLIYGPSAVSLEYALSYYNLIPEGVRSVTSVTTGRSRSYTTPLGHFSYIHLSSEKFAHGLSRIQDRYISIIITTPLKALADKVWTDKRFQPISPASYETYLFHDLRLDRSILKEFYDEKAFREIERCYHARKITWLGIFLRRWVS